MTDPQRPQAPPVEQPLVRIHTPTARLVLYLGSHGQEFIGCSEQESRGLFGRTLNRCAETRFI